MNSHKTPNLRARRAIAALAVTACLTASAYAGKKAPEAKPAAQYAAFDAHSDDKVTIAIDPCNDPKDCDFFRLPYVRHSLIPVRVIITNDSDATLDLSDVRMQFISAQRDKLPAANLEDINRRLFSTKQAKGTKLPIIPIPIHHKPVDQKIVDDDKDFGFQSMTVAPRSTAAGYLFYDVRDIDDDSRVSPLRDAEIYIKMIHIKGGKELFAFSIPFNKWLNGKTPQKASSGAARNSQSACVLQ